MTCHRVRSWIGGFAILGVALACGDTEQPVPQGPTNGTAVADSGNLDRRFYERNFVFASVAADSVFIVPWLMQTAEEADSVTREARAWLARGGIWDGFYEERWRTGPTRAPARLVPHLGLQLMVGDNDAIDGILYEEGARSLELVLGDANLPWTGARGDTYQVLSGAAYLVDQRIDGMILDMARASAGPVPPGGDWAFLLSGDSAHFVLAGDSEYGGDRPPLYRGWGAHEDEGMQWPEVRVDWERTEAFPPARRDVPVEWRVWSADGSIEGRLEAVSAEIQAGEGPGPLLPVRALFEVTGEFFAGEDTYGVHGILVHARR
ncbi:MAG: hypothetical protein ACPHWZ_12730 [Longimicrobiales bacterium]|jgi:hypothetical protein